MKQEESTKHASLQFRCRKIAAPVMEKPNSLCPAAIQNVKVEGDQDSGKGIESPTPEKPECKRKIKGASSILKGKNLFDDSHEDGVETQSEESDPETNNKADSSERSNFVLNRSQEGDIVELPEEYNILSVLFDRMISSIRLLALRKRLPIFRNISTQVERLSKRKLLCSHLAQMKYAFPEAIQIEKILIHDEESLCVVPDMKITLVQSVIESTLNADQSASVALCKAFHSRLVDIFKANPEGIAIPQAMLPEPFSQGNQGIPRMLLKGSSEGLTQRTSSEGLTQRTYSDLEFLSSASHFSSSFHHQFSQKMITETENIEPPAITVPLLSISSVDEEIEVSKNPQMEAIQYPVPPVKSPIKPICTPSRVTHLNSESTPAKCSSNIDLFMTETPSQQTPKRPVPSTDEKIAPGNEKLVTEPKAGNSVRRSLILSPSKPDGSLSNASYTSAQDGVHNACRKTTISKGISGNEVMGTNLFQMASETATGSCEDHIISQAGQEKRWSSQSCLLGMFDTICYILRSTDCSLITKQELVHKIILNNLDIEETSEVEDQLQLLEELVPDWISKKDVSNGDCFYCIKQVYDRESVRAKLVEAL
ncbi:uncharacterized protein A4U43_C10F11150 [Asparagus officinalis]|uniref:CDT1 Geminin-binding domain-containing protein n=1 Tax=Asparagus officinalis TaxID=4686 RepID=A0A5P1E3T7_ASPOF|nr:CDT1-like protein a, chloroplastic [Asparagus officinalis]ONK56643.1 uncharacterized protein A4U43_C10F11150 [Asparagus officinalis]